MTPADLERIIAAGESLAVEFKGEEREPLSDADLVEAVVCLTNLCQISLPQADQTLQGLYEQGLLPQTKARGWAVRYEAKAR